MTQYTTIELYKEAMKFSAAHFTIFSATERERLHGHNYQVYAAFTTAVCDNGMSEFDYRFYKNRLMDLCRALNECVLIPTKSAYLTVKPQGKQLVIQFSSDEFRLPLGDVKQLPIENITLESLSAWFIAQLLEDQSRLTEHGIKTMLIKVYSGPGQSGSHTWQASD